MTSLAKTLKMAVISASELAVISVATVKVADLAEAPALLLVAVSDLAIVKASDSAVAMMASVAAKMTIMAPLKEVSVATSISQAERATGSVLAAVMMYTADLRDHPITE